MVKALAEGCREVDGDGRVKTVMVAKDLEDDLGFLDKGNYKTMDCIVNGCAESASRFYASGQKVVYVRPGEFAVIGIREGWLTNFERSPVPVRILLDVEGVGMSEEEKGLYKQFAERSSVYPYDCDEFLNLALPTVESAFSLAAVVYGVSDESDGSSGRLLYDKREDLFKKVVAAKTPKEAKQGKLGGRSFNAELWDGPDGKDGLRFEVMKRLMAAKLSTGDYMDRMGKIAKFMLDEFKVYNERIYFMEMNPKCNKWGDGKEWVDTVSA